MPQPAWVSDGRHAVAMAAMAWLLLILLIVPEGLDYASLSAAAPSSGSAGSRLLWLGLLGASSMILIWRSALAWLLMSQFNRFLLLFGTLAIASLAWSPEPAFTVRRLIRLVTIVLVALAFVLVSWHRQRFQNVLRPLLTGLLAGSIVFSLLDPALGVHHEVEAGIAGSWRGLTNHKNTLGMLSCTGLILWAHAALARSASLSAIAFGAAVSTICLLMSRSSTSLMTAMLVLPGMVLLIRAPMVLRPYMRWLVCAFAALALVYAVAVLRLVPGAELLLQPIAMVSGKDLSFTGRSEIWRIVGEQVSLHPWLGTGYGAYWIGPQPRSPSYEFLARMYFYPGSGHNGYLDIVNDLGAAGLVCLLAYLAVYVQQAMRVLEFDREQGGLFLTLFAQHAIANFSESLWLNTLSVGLVVMTLATAALARSLVESRLVAVFGPHPSTSR